MESIENARDLDITPHPRILKVLGEIEFKPWQCIAELIDNGIDGFLDSQRSGSPIADPTIKVALGRETVEVIDNGPGMTLSNLEKAIRAGWSSHEVFGSLGIYGMGFNIATARLGTKTEIWTTVKGETCWWVVEIDLQRIISQGGYTLTPKMEIKSDPQMSGTKVRVSNLKADWRQPLVNPNWVRSNITETLARVYGTMLRENYPQPIGFSLLVDNRRVSAWEHCVWPADWEVYKRTEGNVRPIKEIDVTFGTQYLDKSTGEIHATSDEIDPANLVEIPERVYGWIGLQRYAHPKDFGIDILRNGRKIEVACKDVFDWDEVPEYPIDDPRGRGRIVGEIHLDHGYVHYTKHRFERDHASWTQLLFALKNNEPLTNRDRVPGLTGPNTSPLGTLFRAFRRNTPASGQTWSDLLSMPDNDEAIRWAEKWRKREPEYRNDQKWRDALTPNGVNSGTVLTPPATPTPAGAENGNGESTNGPDGNDGFPQRPLTGLEPPPAAVPDPNIPPPRSRTRLAEHNLHVTGIGPTNRSYDFEVFSLEPIQGTAPYAWHSHATARGVYEIEIDLCHPAFNSTSLQPRDAILSEVAHIITSEEQSTVSQGDPIYYGDTLASLRGQYSLTDSLDSTQLQHEIDQIREFITRKLTASLDVEGQSALLQILPKEAIERINLEMAQAPVPGVMTDYFDLRSISKVLENSPATLFDAGCFMRSWTPPNLVNNPALLDEHRKRLRSDLVLPLYRLGEYSGGQAGIGTPSKVYLALVRACANYIQDQLSSEYRHA